MVPYDSLGAVHLNAVTSDLAQRLYFNIAAPVRSSNATTVPGRHRVTLACMQSAAAPLRDWPWLVFIDDISNAAEIKGT
jgi:hypothetical protein